VNESALSARASIPWQTHCRIGQHHGTYLHQERTAFPEGPDVSPDVHCLNLCCDSKDQPHSSDSGGRRDRRPARHDLRIHHLRSLHADRDCRRTGRCSRTSCGEDRPYRDRNDQKLEAALLFAVARSQQLLEESRSSEIRQFWKQSFESRLKDFSSWLRVETQQHFFAC
jgi:hypothetical protein